jgi:hypothetical protein
MKKYLKIRKIILLLMLTLFSISLYSQFSCTYQKVETFPKGYNLNLKSASMLTSVTDFKTVRVNVHFILKTDGTGNFTETKDINGNTCSYNGYWFAGKCIELCNSQLTNEPMTQQLSNQPILVNPINYCYKLVGVYFHRSDTYFNTPGTNYSLSENNTEVINISIYPNNDGSGAAASPCCWVGGANVAYTYYLQYGNWGIEQFSLTINHEIGHCLSLDHCKRYAYYMPPPGNCCTSNSSACLDDCDDTPTFLELINDGYTDPCIWYGTGYSNNIMDYSPLPKAFTPCQIEKVHNHLDTSKPYFLYTNFKNQTAQVTSFTDNKAYIANAVTITPSSSITIANNKRLYIDSKTLLINDLFEVPLGSAFEYIPNGL